MALEGIKTVLGAFRSNRGHTPGVFDLAQKAKELIERGEHEAARQILREALDRFPGHSSLEDVNYYLGQRWLRESLAELRRVTDEARKMYIRSARAYADTNNTQKAVDFLSGALRRFPECPELHIILGELYLRRFLDDKSPEDGRRALEALEGACRLDPGNTTARKYLAGLYARIGCFCRAMEYLTSLADGDFTEDEQRYVRELHSYCSRHASNSAAEDIAHALAEVWDRGEFAVDCRGWASPAPPAFARHDLNTVMIPFAVMELTARKCVDLPGVSAAIVENQIRSKIIKADGCDRDLTGLEQAVREVADRSTDACHRMGLGHVKRCDLRTSMGPVSLHMFADTWLGLLFEKGSSTTQVRTVTQQCLDLMAEGVGGIDESDS